MLPTKLRSRMEIKYHRFNCVIDTRKENDPKRYVQDGRLIFIN